ncbi:MULTISPECIES: ABC transporter ATP-binding protein [Helcococcus]|uniref:ABC transporter ATP-binding protein n=1 Tax=Helcococcus bovis TaxID=3153252 RepID=A0ABW9F447_9FIRM
MLKNKVIIRLMKETWNIDKKYFLFLFLNIIFNTAVTISTMYLPALIIDMVMNKKSFNEIIIIALTFYLGLYFIRQISEFITMKLSKLDTFIAKMLESKISEKALTIKYKELEKPATLDLIQRSEMPISWGIINFTLEAIQNILKAVFAIVSLIAILFYYSVTYTIILSTVLIVSSFIGILFRKKRDVIMQENVPVNRKFSYFFGNALEDKHQKEFRIYKLSNLWKEKIDFFNNQVFEWIKKLTYNESVTSVVEVISTTLITFIAIAFNAIRLLSDKFGPIISIGQFTLIYNSTNTIAEEVKNIARSISTFNMATAHLTPWNDFLELENDKFNGTIETSEFETLEFRNVTFTYPNTDRIILDDVSFKINKGEKISIVGLNNAGKSTIVKLICKFFTPDSGEILWNGVNIYDIEEESYIKQISAVFQDFKLFPYTIFENIMPHENNRDKAIKSLEQVNMLEAVNKLEKGIDTYLDKTLEENATNFSGGQNQKLAIARAINKGGSLMILDEPTAALDPIAESEIFEKFASLTENKTSIFISHRMSSSTFSDKVLLLDGGKIVGFDSHKNLMQGHNLYRELFEAQAQNYS